MSSSLTSLHFPDLAKQTTDYNNSRSNFNALQDDSTTVNYRIPRVPPQKSYKALNGYSTDSAQRSHFTEEYLPASVKTLSCTLPAVPTRRNVKPHIPFQKRASVDSSNFHGRQLHQPLLRALSTNIPKEERKQLRKKLLSEVTSQHNTYKTNNGGVCIVFDAIAEVNGSSFLTQWRTVNGTDQQDEPRHLGSPSSREGSKNCKIWEAPKKNDYLSGILQETSNGFRHNYKDNFKRGNG